MADVIYFDNYTIVILKPEKENGTVNNKTRHLRYYSVTYIIVVVYSERNWRRVGRMAENK